MSEKKHKLRMWLLFKLGAVNKCDYDTIIDEHVEIICLTCQSVRAGSVYSLSANTMRLYWQEETEVYQNACPDCGTAYTLQVQPYEGSI